jgi:DNA-binding transcriptional LysR family regulator
MATMLHAALDGFGIALLPEFLACAHPQLGKLTPETAPPVRPMFLVMHPDVRRSRRVRLVADRLAQAMKSSAYKANN